MPFEMLHAGRQQLRVYIWSDKGSDSWLSSKDATNTGNNKTMDILQMAEGIVHSDAPVDWTKLSNQPVTNILKANSRFAPN